MPRSLYSRSTFSGLKSRHCQQLQHSCGNLLAELLEAWMGAGPVQLGDDVRDGIADTRSFREPLLRDQAIKRDSERRQAIRSDRGVLRPGPQVRTCQACRNRSGPISPCSNSETKMPSGRRANSRARFVLRRCSGKSLRSSPSRVRISKA